MVNPQTSAGNIPESPIRQFLVLPDRDSAEETIESIAARWPGRFEPELVREALAGEDDAEDAQWLVVLERPPGDWTDEMNAELDALATGHAGWREEN